MALNTESTVTTCLVVANENNNLSVAKTKKDSKRSIEEHFDQLEQTIFFEGLTSEVSTVPHLYLNFNIFFRQQKILM